MGNKHPSPESKQENERTGNAPERLWLPFIREMYPNLHGQTYFFPPTHFHNSPHSVHLFAGQVVARVRDNNPQTRSKRPRKRPPPGPPSPQAEQQQVCGTVFADNLPDLQAVRIQDSDRQDDEAHERCLQLLSGLGGEVMMVISRLCFRKYLDNQSNPERLTNPLHAAAIAQLPSLLDPSVPERLVDGECDLLILHRHHGLVIGEIKSVGGGEYFSQQCASTQNQIIVRRVGDALRQLNSQEQALRHLVHDLPQLRITKTLLLPNLTLGQLRSALATSADVTKLLRSCMDKADLSKALRRCVCQDKMTQPSALSDVLAKRADPNMAAHVYERLLARFCGPASTVEIPTAGCPSRVLRTLGQAVAHTGLCFSSLTLTPTQVDLLNREPEPHFMFLHGPPGTGKTVVLALKALQWARQDKQVVILSSTPSSDPVAILIEAQLGRLLGSEKASAHVQRVSYDFFDQQFHAEKAADVVQQLVVGRPGPLLVLFDELDVVDRRQFFQWFIHLRKKVPEVCLWAAGIWRLNAGVNVTLPPWVEVQTLQEPLRCPPNVVKELKVTGLIRSKMVLPYHDPSLPVPTLGPELRCVAHKDHQEEDPLNCLVCAHSIGAFLKEELRVGQPGHSLHYKDVWVLYENAPRSAQVLVQQLQHHYQLPVREVGVPTSPGDQQDLALAVTDQILVTHFMAVQGLERRVVVAMAEDSLEAMSRCTACLCCVV